MRVALINAPQRSIVCEQGVGHQMPVGLLMIGGPLLDAGHDVTFIDAERKQLTPSETARLVCAGQPEVVVLSHVASTPGHPVSLETLRAIKARNPSITTVYGGVYPTYHDREILEHELSVDVVVRGEGEATVQDLIATLAEATRLERGDSLVEATDLSAVAGITWRQAGTITANPARTAIRDLDAYRIGWELIDDWDGYQAFGMGRAAVVQFSRGCPHTCTYCGQWMFWKKWRHRDVTRFVDEIEWLYREKGVRFFWLADENPTTIKGVWASVLDEIAGRNLDIGICASIRAGDIVRDADILHLYRNAGFLYVLMGVETVSDDALERIRKGSSVDDAYQAVRLLRQHGIMSIVDYMFGIEDETAVTIRRGLAGLHRYDGDFVNALYLTPHDWTPLGHAARSAPVVEPDLARWDYRHQVLAVRTMSPGRLVVAVKLVELIYHLHPQRLWRVVAHPDRRLRRHLRFSYLHTARVFLAEVFEAFKWRRSPARQTVWQVNRKGEPVAVSR